MEYLFIWFLCAIGAAVIAKHKGRSPGGWFCLGLLFGVFALLVAVLPSTEAQDEAQARAVGAAGDFRRCPVCAEAIRVAAQKCRYCQSNLLLGLKPRSFQEPSTTSEGPGRDHEAGLRPVELD